MFDGAAAAATEQHHVAERFADTEPAAFQTHGLTLTPRAAATAPAPSAARELLVIDSRIQNGTELAKDLPSNVSVLVVQPGQDGLAAISAALDRLGKVDSIQIVSHGAPGQFTLGDRTITSSTIDQLGNELASWRSSLTADADILLLGCNVGADASGQALVHELAHWTGAGVAASSDNTGSVAAGGNWTLEVHDGAIDHPLAISAEARAGFQGLLVDASPTVTLSSAGGDVLLGDQVTFTASFTNTSTQDGYAPFIDLFFPATGKDGDDGVSFVSATYLGRPVTAYVITFDASGNAVHPLAKDATGQAVVLHAANYGLRPGDELVVLQLPYASVGSAQPSVDVQVTAHLSNLADTAFSNGSPNLSILAQGGFQFGNDSLDNPTQDPSLIEAATHSYAVHPTVITLTQTVNTPEGKTSSGPNYARSITVTASPAPGQSLTDVVVTQNLPSDIMVTAITPSAGGVVTEVMLANGTVLSNPTLIQAALAGGAYVANYSVTYAALTGPSDINIAFFVPQADANGDPILNPATGAAVTITVDGASATGEWTPLDPRDLTPPATEVALSGTGPATSFVVQSLSLYKTAAITGDIGTPGLTPGDRLTYSVELDLSDYFAFGMNIFNQGHFLVKDTLGDGQTLSGTPTMSISLNGVTQTVALVVTTIVNADGTTSLAFDIGQSILNARGQLGGLQGDLAFDAIQQGATKVVISYQAVVSQAYTTVYPQSEINEGDSISNNASVDATVLEDPVNLGTGVVGDTDARTETVPVSDVDIAISSVNGGAVPANGELRPGDVVTFTMSYDLVTGDYENMSLSAYMPLPLFDITGISWTQGNGVDQWHLGAGNTNAGGLLSVTTGAGNAIVFNFGSFATAATVGSRIEVQFTVVVGNQPFADQRALSVLAKSDQTTTIDHTHLLSSEEIAVISSIAEPEVSIVHGVVSSTNGTITGTTGTWSAPGTGGAPFTGSITDPKAVNGDITGIDAGDTLRMATELKNTGGGAAFDLSTDILLPTGFSFVGGSLASANLHLYRGDGTALVLGVDYSVSGNTITLLDANGTGTLTAGRAGSAADATGANVIIITYDVTVNASIAASSTLQSTADLLHYASTEGGANFVGSISETAAEQVAAPTVRVVYAGGSLDNSDSSAPQTNGSDLVIGESMLYDIVVTLPEGSTQSLRLQDLIPAGMRLDTSFNGTGYQIITTSGGSAALLANFNGNVVISGLSGSGGTLGADGVDALFTFSASTANGDNNTGNNAFVIRVRLVASNVISNQAGTTLSNPAQIVYSDPDGDTPNGATAIDRTVASAGAAPTIVIREPTLTIQQTTDPLPPFGVEETIPVTYQIIITNGSSSADFNAYDISLNDVLPTQMSGYTILGVTYSGGASNNGGQDFVIVNGVLQTASGARVDIPTGGSIVIRVNGTVNASAASVASFDNTATVAWTSLDGPNSGERTGADGLLNSGVLNDYSAASTLTVPVLRGVYLSRVGGLPQTSPASPTDGDNENVTVGEVIHYRAVGAFAQGITNDFVLQITLPNGIGFINDGTVRLVFISNNGIVSSIGNLVTGGTLNIVGNAESPQAQPLLPDLSGPGATGVFNPSQITISTDANGNTVISFHFGNITNTDIDPDVEGFALEFNARVLNQASNTAGDALPVVAAEFAGTTALSTSQPVYEDIVEPSFNGLNKQIIDFTPNVTATTGMATVSVSFTQNGGSPAFDVVLSDNFAGGSAYTFNGLIINGTAYTLGNLPPGVTVDTSNGVTVHFGQLNPGDSVRFTYNVTVPDLAPEPGNNATLTWTSLSDSFTQWGGSLVGPAGSSTGERTGQGGVNTYVLSEGAGLGVISGTLWNDTASATTSTTPDGPGLAGQTVTLTWGGLDGNLATTADNRSFTTVTDANGNFSFGALPSGAFRIDAPASATYALPTGTLRVRIDTDTSSPLGQVVVNLGEGVQVAANAGYVHQNVAPQNQLPGTQNGLEDVVLAISGISISDVDAGAGTVGVTLTVLHGTLALGSAAGVTVSGSNTSQLVITGTIANINAALATLTYIGLPNYNGDDTLSIVTNDQGNFGDANGDGIPGQNPGDALTATGAVAIVLQPVNDPPSAVPDTDDAVEAGGTNNQTEGVDPKGNMLDNDTDVDIATNGDFLTLTGVQLLPGGPVVAPLANGGTASVTGLYGTLYFLANGSYQYVVDNGNPTVQALRTCGQTLTETFSYTAVDTGALGTGSTLTITIHGANDTPVGVPDVGNAVEKGGVNNGTAGSDATGNVLANDTDVDSAANGEVLSVYGVRTHSASGVGPVVLVTAGTTSASGGAVLNGLYGTLTIGADGSYVYTVFDNNATVQALMAGETLNDTFDYAVEDAGGLLSITQLNIVIHGSNDNPVATDDVAQAQAASTNDDTHESNPSGNVILFASRPGNPTDPGGNGIDYDVDHADQPNTNLTVTGAASGGSLTGALDPVGVITGLYGTLTIHADGSYTYNVDSANATVLALSAGQTVLDVFTYQIVDTEGLTARANLTITVHGAEDPPVAQNVTSFAREAGGVNNATPGLDPTGDATVNSLDPDGDPITVIGIRTGDVAGTGTAGTVGTALAGLYGTLTIDADGTYRYVVDNSNATVQALRTASDVLREDFTFTITDGVFQSSAEIHIFISGQNDNPVASDDAANATEAGGLNNNRPGVDPAGNVLGNDTDVDAGDALAVTAIRTGAEAGTGTAGTVGAELAGQFGWLTVNADGSYAYRVNNTLAAVQALRSSTDTLTESFSYTVTDLAGATDVATLTIVIHGSNDTPVAVDDAATAVEAGGINNGTPGVNPTGNVLSNDSDVDAFGEALRVTGFDSATTHGNAGESLAGTYGTLTLNADGTYSYVLDNNNAAVQALRTSGDTLSETFNYSIADVDGAVSSAQLVIVIHGANDAPHANDDTADAIEAGGINNGTPGTSPSGNLLSNDTDVDANDTMVVSGVRVGPLSAGGTVTGIPSHSQVSIAGTYGTLLVSDNGDYTYQLDDSSPVVQALQPGQTLTEIFSYMSLDAAGAPGAAQLTITIHGSNDTPTATVMTVSATEAGGVSNATSGVDPTGNVLSVVTDVDAGPGDLSVVAFDNGQNSGTVGDALAGKYGSITLNADGSFQYLVDNNNAAVQGLRTSTDRLIETFNVTVSDQFGATTTTQIVVVIHGANDAPVAHDDIADAFEAGGADNNSPGVNPSGDVLLNDTDVDSVANGETKTVIAIRTGAESGTGTAGTLGTELRGLYGWLTILPDGTASYRLDNDDPTVQALRGSNDTLSESFTYTMSDTDGLTDAATITIVIHGANDAPVAVNDTATAIEAGGVNNGTPGFNPSGNVLTNDSDVDAGDQLSVAGVLGAGGFGGAGAVVAGRYGTVVVNADGSYSYQLDNDNADVQALRLPTDTLTEVFVYTVHDLAGATATATLTITIHGANDNPHAVSDLGVAVETGGLNNATAGTDPSGNVLANDTDVDANDSKTVDGIRAGGLLSPGPLQSISAATTVAGQYGTLVIAPDGSYHYALDNDLAAVQALLPGQSLIEVFTYRVVDRLGASDTTELRIVIQGSNDTPIAIDDSATAVEAGGIHNGTPGVDPVGNVLDNDTDVDGVANGETKQVVDYRTASGSSSVAGQALAGAYGTLTIGADGSYQYVVDNNNPLVQALRTRDQTLTEVFSYTMRDANGATSVAHLTITIQGSNDNPVAVDDSGQVSDQTPGQQVGGQVLPNDSDVDAGDALVVKSVRAGAENEAGAELPVGQKIAGRYGSLVLNADGSYVYTIDMSNPAVLAAAGLGQVLDDVFTYTIADLAGATDSAQLVIHLNISAPRPPLSTIGPQFPDRPGVYVSGLSLPEVDPKVYVLPAVNDVAQDQAETAIATGGNDPQYISFDLINAQSIGEGLGLVPGQVVHHAVQRSQQLAAFDLAKLFARHGRVSLSADGLLPDPSIFASTPGGLASGEFLRDASGHLTARGFRDQLRDAANRRPLHGR
ncbi:VCBS domain-containing protein [Dyella japonica]|uniref:VCBS domain-containing protein n=1 Tax=Dyella japonica TaxID=231455 RepID=UPI00069A8194|nr:VCBS domain-containing protein [Dyella japonica]